ncbi:S8 family peptidase [Bacillus sp. FSL K6-0047]
MDEKNERKKSKEPKPHLVIPDDEVIDVNYTPTSRPPKTNIDQTKHGISLKEGFKSIAERHREKISPFSEEIVVFKVELQEEECADARGNYEKIFENNQLKINTMRRSHEAVVSTTFQNFKVLNEKLDNYASGKNKYDFFNLVSSFKRIEKQDKQINFSEISTSDKEIDVQITLLPHLSENQNSRMITYINELLKSMDGKMLSEFYLSDKTPVIRALIPSSGLNQAIDEEIIMQIEPTPFLSPTNRKGNKRKSVGGIRVEFESNPEELPLVCVLDDGIRFPDNLSDCLAGMWQASDIDKKTSCNHGTKVASRVVLGDDIDAQYNAKLFTPKVRVIDARICDGYNPVYEGDFIRRIREAVLAIKEQTRIFCLSFNSNDPIDSFKVSNLAFELDVLSKRHDVQFILSMGNHDLWTIYDSLAEIIDDDDSRLASPGESFFGITVGSVSRENHQYSMSGKYQLSPFSRVGYGVAGCEKPNIVYPGGNVYKRDDKKFIAANSAAYVISKNGEMIQEYGTSFSAPLAARDIAILNSSLPHEDLLIAKALLLHHCENELETLNQQEREIYQRMHGVGIANKDLSQYSYANISTYIRRGQLKRLTKQRVKFYMPTVMADQSKRGKQVCKVKVTCLSVPKVDKQKGEQYLRGYVDTSFKKINSNGTLTIDNPPQKIGRGKWKHVHHFSSILTTFNSGEYEIWLTLYTKPEITDDEEVDYALIVSIENLTETDLDIHESITQETHNRFRYLQEVEVDNLDVSEME